MTIMKSQKERFTSYFRTVKYRTWDAFPNFKGNLFIGALVLHHVNRLVFEGNRVVKEERLLENMNWRVRFVRQGPDDFLYIGVDGGMILRLSPVD